MCFVGARAASTNWLRKRKSCIAAGDARSNLNTAFLNSSASFHASKSRYRRIGAMHAISAAGVPAVIAQKTQNW
jgi:hypothetical protein